MFYVATRESGKAEVKIRAPNVGGYAREGLHSPCQRSG